MVKTEIANKFNIFYLAQHKLRQIGKKKGMICSKLKSANRGDSRLEELFSKEFSVEELREAIRNTSKKNQSGPDGIFPEFVKSWP